MGYGIVEVGAEMKIDKQYARRSIVNYISPYPDPFTYQSLVEMGEKRFVDAYAETLIDSLSRDILSTDAQAEFESLKKFAHTGVSRYVGSTDVFNHA